MSGWIVGWPSDPKRKRWVGYGRIVREIVAGNEIWLLVESLDLFDGEPPYHELVSIREPDLRLFETLEAYQAWISYWRQGDEPPAAWSAHTHGTA